jgi:hypothetical protein
MNDTQMKVRLEVAKFLARRFEGREWQRYPNPNQATFQAKMERTAGDVLKLVENLTSVLEKDNDG